jgi:hypothetical protein
MENIKCDYCIVNDNENGQDVHVSVKGIPPFFNNGEHLLELMNEKGPYHGFEIIYNNVRYFISSVSFIIEDGNQTLQFNCLSKL